MAANVHDAGSAVTKGTTGTVVSAAGVARSGWMGTTSQKTARSAEPAVSVVACMQYLF